MRISRVAGLSAAVIVLAGCGTGSQQPLAPQASAPVTGASDSQVQAASRAFALSLNRLRTFAAVRSNRPSWMAPDAKTKQLLYVSDADTAEVYVYSYPSEKKLVGTLTGFGWPYGMCTDATGDVYVTDLLGAQVVEYKHGKAKPVRTLSAPGAPIGCAVDPTTGNLAVASFDAADPSTGFGGIFIFPNGSSTGTLYIDPTLSYYWPPAYDEKGNLYFEGEMGSNNALDELHAGAGTLSRISLNTTIGLPAGVQWDGKYVAAADQRYQGQFTTAIYQVSVSGSTGTVVNTIQLGTSGSCSDLDIIQPLLANRRRLIGANPQCATVSYWNYPGGMETATFFGPPFGAPGGVALSK